MCAASDKMTEFEAYELVGTGCLRERHLTVLETINDVAKTRWAS